MAKTEKMVRTQELECRFFEEKHDFVVKSADVLVEEIKSLHKKLEEEQIIRTQKQEYLKKVHEIEKYRPLSLVER